MIVDGIETPSLAKDILVMEEVKAWSAKKRGMRKKEKRRLKSRQYDVMGIP